MQSIGIVCLSIVCCVTYGILLDQITVRICLEYFTIGHPPLFPTDHPTLLALGWGVIATWWVGAILGVPLSLAARFGNAPKRTARQLVRPMLTLMLLSGVFACMMAGIGFVLAKNDWIFLVGDFARRVPRSQHVSYLTDLWAHSASYFAGFVGGVVLIVSTWRIRNTSTT